MHRVYFQNFYQGHSYEDYDSAKLGHADLVDKFKDVERLCEFGGSRFRKLFNTRKFGFNYRESSEILNLRKIE